MKKHMLIVRIDEDIFEMLRKIAYEDRISINKIVSEAIDEYLKKN